MMNFIKRLMQKTCYEFVKFLKTLNFLISNLLKSSTQFSPNFKKLKTLTGRSARCRGQHKPKFTKDA
jgi:hypothetical protein